MSILFIHLELHCQQQTKGRILTSREIKMLESNQIQAIEEIEFKVLKLIRAKVFKKLGKQRAHRINSDSIMEQQNKMVIITWTAFSIKKKIERVSKITIKSYVELNLEQSQVLESISKMLGRICVKFTANISITTNLFSEMLAKPQTVIQKFQKKMKMKKAIQLKW